MNHMFTSIIADTKIQFTIQRTNKISSRESLIDPGQFVLFPQLSTGAFILILYLFRIRFGILLY